MNNQCILKKILIAPLDWGLGHATRCIPLISYLLSLNCEVTIAASPASKALLQKEFPALQFLNLNSYNIVYSRKKRWMPFKILLQTPKILRAVNQEHEWLKNLLATRHFDAIISDNRYGFYSEKVFSVFITHQLQVRTSLNLARNFVRKQTYKRINKFNECWVPDFEGNLNIAGELSHPKTLPQVPVKYLGTLSRFKEKMHENNVYKYLIIISGPEPQRTIFEEKVFAFAKSSKEKILIVLGKPEEKNSIEENSNSTICNHLTTAEMEDAFNASEFIISRCGYTSVMEILSVQKKSILIPTPGQTEQEYLAKHLTKQSWCYTFSQNEDFNLHFIKAHRFKYNLPNVNAKQYEAVLKEFISDL
ncbi:MAG TPA: glycosyltransferase [Parafilimonas sp.]|nr:glycosyltransferase [Parafilimonas sp.]